MLSGDFRQFSVERLLRFLAPRRRSIRMYILCIPDILEEI